MAAPQQRMVSSKGEGVSRLREPKASLPLPAAAAPPSSLPPPPADPAAPPRTPQEPPRAPSSRSSTRQQLLGRTTRRQNRRGGKEDGVGETKGERLERKPTSRERALQQRQSNVIHSQSQNRSASKWRPPKEYTNIPGGGPVIRSQRSISNGLSAALRRFAISFPSAENAATKGIRHPSGKRIKSLNRPSDFDSSPALYERPNVKKPTKSPRLSYHQPSRSLKRSSNQGSLSAGPTRRPPPLMHAKERQMPPNPSSPLKFKWDKRKRTNEWNPEAYCIPPHPGIEALDFIAEDATSLLPPKNAPAWMAKKWSKSRKAPPPSSSDEFWEASCPAFAPPLPLSHPRASGHPHASLSVSQKQPHPITRHDSRSDVASSVMPPLRFCPPRPPFDSVDETGAEGEKEEEESDFPHLLLDSISQAPPPSLPPPIVLRPPSDLPPTLSLSLEPPHQSATLSSAHPHDEEGKGMQVELQGPLSEDPPARGRRSRERRGASSRTPRTTQQVRPAIPPPIPFIFSETDLQERQSHNSHNRPRLGVLGRRRQMCFSLKAGRARKSGFCVSEDDQESKIGVGPSVSTHTTTQRQATATAASAAGGIDLLSPCSANIIGQFRHQLKEAGMVRPPPLPPSLRQCTLQQRSPRDPVGVTLSPRGGGSSLLCMDFLSPSAPSSPLLYGSLSPSGASALSP
eukprot:Cvel_11308.t2-p1 / transcript=Cvel_11308.t2 / gene=Cvel_11308 / organism=Chromera_velia_CCMP2878 / gene_product=hypothetical protein / transcript_product=hypothetical protein / location=Cvel_scaffold707:4551-6599(-) / protein_length=683 / sequence_SO=supercontig / SO=protein_coding / is_pseudo=false